MFRGSAAFATPLTMSCGEVQLEVQCERSDADVRQRALSDGCYGEDRVDEAEREVYDSGGAPGRGSKFIHVGTPRL